MWTNELRTVQNNCLHSADMRKYVCILKKQKKKKSSFHFLTHRLHSMTSVTLKMTVIKMYLSVLQICISLWSCLTWEILLIGHRSQIFYQQPEKPLSGSYQIWATISDKKDTSQWPPFMYEELRLLLLLLQPLLNHWLDELWNIILLYVSESFVP